MAPQVGLESTVKRSFNKMVVGREPVSAHYCGYEYVLHRAATHVAHFVAFLFAKHHEVVTMPTSSRELIVYVCHALGGTAPEPQGRGWSLNAGAIS